MKFYLISDDRDTLTGMHLAGIEGKYCEDMKTAEKEMLEATKNEEIGILLITNTIAAACPETVSNIKLNYTTPLLVEIPGSNDSQQSADNIVKIVQDIIGI